MTTSAGGVGEVERNRARGLLDDHWRAGRIEPGEHERRVTMVRRASTAADLDVALQGLPLAGLGGSSAPVIAPDEPRGSVGATAPPAPDSTVSEDVERSNRTGGMIKIDRKTAQTLVTLTPFICMLLVFGFGGPWVVWLAIVMVPLVLYGRDGLADENSERRALRHERKARRHQQVAQKHRRRKRR